MMLWVRLPLKARRTTLCDKVCQRLAAGRWFSPGSLVSSTNKTNRKNITEILLKVAIKLKTKPTNVVIDKNVMTNIKNICYDKFKECHHIAEILLKLALNTNQSIIFKEKLYDLMLNEHSKLHTI
jgi:hypothetical protein